MSCFRSALVFTLLAASLPARATEPPATPTPSTERAPAVSPTPAPAVSVPATRYRLLVMDLKGNDVDAATVETLMGIVTAGIGEYPELDVVSREDLKNLVQLEAEKDNMGCTADASCMAEIADALGAELVVFGTVGRLDESLVLNLNLFDSRQATSLGRIVVQSDTLKKMPRALRPKLRDLVGKFYASRNLTLAPYVELPPETVEVPPPSPLPWILVAAGGVALVGGGAVATIGALPWFQYENAKARVLAAEEAFAEEPSALDDAKRAQTDLNAARGAWNSYGFLALDVGAGLAAVGLGTAIAGAVMLATQPAPPDEARPAEGGAK